MNWQVEVGFKAWSHAPLGESELEHHAVVKDSKMVVVSPSYPILKLVGPRYPFYIIAIPKLEHSRNFSSAAVGTNERGPSEDFPGTVGSIECKFVEPINREEVEETAKLKKGEYENMILVKNVKRIFELAKRITLFREASLQSTAAGEIGALNTP